MMLKLRLNKLQSSMQIKSISPTFLYRPQNPSSVWFEFFCLSGTWQHKNQKENLHWFYKQMSLSYLYHMLNQQVALCGALTQSQMTECNAVVRENLEYQDFDCFSWLWQYAHTEETYSQGYSSNKLLLNLINCIYLT